MNNTMLTEEDKRKVLMLFKPDTNIYKAVKTIFMNGCIHNYNFNHFEPPVLSYRDVIYFMKKAIDEQLPHLKVTRENKGKNFWWNIERRSI